MVCSWQLWALHQIAKEGHSRAPCAASQESEAPQEAPGCRSFSWFSSSPGACSVSARGGGVWYLSRTAESGAFQPRSLLSQRITVPWGYRMAMKKIFPCNASARLWCGRELEGRTGGRQTVLDLRCLNQDMSLFLFTPSSRGLVPQWGFTGGVWPVDSHGQRRLRGA